MNLKTVNPNSIHPTIIDKSLIERTLTEAVSLCADETGWANLAEIGTLLRNAGIHYGKLSRFLNDYGHLVQKKIDTSVTPPVVLAKLIKN